MFTFINFTFHYDVLFPMQKQCNVVPSAIIKSVEILSPSSGLAVCFSEMLVSTYKSTRRHFPEDQHRHLPCYYLQGSSESPMTHIFLTAVNHVGLQVTSLNTQDEYQ
jgi:hypothetical protein